MAPFVEEVSGLTADQVQKVLEEHPEIIDLISLAWEEAAKTQADEKHKLLARVAAQALRNPGGEDLDELLFVARTVTALEPPHMKLLILIATPRGGEGQFAGTRLEGYATQEILEQIWPGAHDFLVPMVAVLDREGLIENRAIETYGGGVAWELTGYGRRFLNRLVDRDAWDFDIADIKLRLEGDHELVVRNLGLGTRRR